MAHLKIYKQSKLRPYESRKGYGFQTAAHELAERMCERKAAQEKRGLPQLFLEDRFWKDFYQAQTYIATKLISEFGKDAVFGAMKRTDLNWAFSLMTPKIRAAIVEENRRLRSKESVVIEEVEKKIEQIEKREKAGIVAPSNISSRRSSGLSRLDD